MGQARRLANALARPEPWSASADALLALLDPKRGCARLARLLASVHSKQRKEAANALLVLGTLEAVAVWKWIWGKADESDTPRLFRLDRSLRRALLDRVGASYENELHRLVVDACGGR